eukprot:gene11082-12250_t
MAANVRNMKQFLSGWRAKKNGPWEVGQPCDGRVNDEMVKAHPWLAPLGTLGIRGLTAHFGIKYFAISKKLKIKQLS